MICAKILLKLKSKQRLILNLVSNTVWENEVIAAIKHLNSAEPEKYRRFCSKFPKTKAAFSDRPFGKCNFSRKLDTRFQSVTVYFKNKIGTIERFHSDFDQSLNQEDDRADKSIKCKMKTYDFTFLSTLDVTNRFSIGPRLVSIIPRFENNMSVSQTKQLPSDSD